MYFIAERGVYITLPPEATQVIAGSASNREPLPWEEQVRLLVMANDPILRGRYRLVSEGNESMEQVCFIWREELYKKAQFMADDIVVHSKEIGKEDFLVLLFGSVARGLSRRKEDPDPSNIDLAVVGDFSEGDRLDLFDRIRDRRMQIQEEIGSNVGVHIQCWEKMSKNDFSAVINYIASSARILYDPLGKWKVLEGKALSIVGERLIKKLEVAEVRSTRRALGIKEDLSEEMFQAAKASVNLRRELVLV